MILLMYTPLLLQGMGITLAAWVVVSCLSLLIGSLLGVISCAYLNNQTIIKVTRVYAFITKGVPAYVQILIAYFVVPSLLGIQVSGFVAASCALSLCSSGYVTEIIRAGMNAIPRGQWEACFVLGYSTYSALKNIIIPQAIRLVMPALIGELEQLLKSTSLLATIGVIDITRAGMNIISRELNPIPVYLLIAVIYLLCSGALNGFIIYYQRRRNYGCH